jgi:CIC family chloride channel protein
LAFSATESDSDVGDLLSSYRRQLTRYDAVWAYSLLGLVGGLASGLVVLAFELAIGRLAMLWGVGEGGENFEALPVWARLVLPAGGAILLGIGYLLLAPEDRETGIVHVLGRMHSHYGALPLRNAMVQFAGGAFALATGQSGGREGPGVHLGGAINSLLGQGLGLPNNSLRVLIACGTAGGIAAAFNTPLAGVIFAMEVIIAEYTVVGFIPVMLAAVTASAASRTLSGGDALLAIPPLYLNSLLEIPFILLLGVCCGVAMAAFIQVCKLGARIFHWPAPLRFGLAGALTGSLALAVPQVLGIGYDTLNLILQGQIGLHALMILALCKLLATAVSCGVGMPIGLIGPNLFIGGCVGGAIGIASATAQPEFASEPTLYAVIGMAAAMGAVLNAPLAAILAVIEMTQNIAIGMPAMLAIVVATLTNSGLLRQRSAHQTELREFHRTVPNNPLDRLLHSTAVTATMDVRAVRVPTLLEPEDRVPLLESTPTWCVVSREQEDLYLVRGSDLLEWLGCRDANPAAGEGVSGDVRENNEGNDGQWRPLDLTEADIRRWTIAQVPVQATLRQALDTMRECTAEAVCVCERSRSSGKLILHGVVTRESIEKFSLARL